MKLWARLKGAVRAVALQWGRLTWSSRSLTLGGTQYNYAGAVGDGRGNAIVAACLEWIARVWPEAPCGVFRRKPDGDLEWRGDHPLTALLERPNAFYGRSYLWAGTLADYDTDGNAYWWKNRSAIGRPVELWWVPAECIEPCGDPDNSTVFISHYEYRVNGQRFRIDRTDIVHFRHGVDPNNPRKGYARIKSLLREIATDDEAANWTASLLRNAAMPGAVIAPGPGVKLSKDFADRVKTEFIQKFGGDRLGEPIVLSGEANITMLGFNPQQMTLREVRRIPEERVSAIFGTPAVVVGLGAGLDRSTFANYAEAREAAYESTIMPRQVEFADELQAQLLPDFADSRRFRIGFDVSRVRVLQEDRTALYTREGLALRTGGITVDEYRTAIGKPELENEQGKRLFLPVGVRVVDVNALSEPAPAATNGRVRALPPAAAVDGLLLHDGELVGANGATNGAHA